MKKILSLLALSCLSMAASAEYTVNYTGTHTHSARQVTAVKVSSNGDAEQSITVDPSTTYNDLSSQKFTVEAGGSIKVSLTHTGNWMNAAVLVDEDKNGAFDYTTGTLSQHTFSGDLKAFSFYCFDGANDQTGYNSLGTQITGDNRSTTNIPEFTAPAAIGEYRMRVLFAWNSVDPAGYSDIYTHGGYIIDVTLNVVEPVAPESYPYLFFKCGRGDSKNGISANNNGTLSTPAYSESDENQKFLLVKIENKSYLYNVGKQKFVTSPASGNNFVLVDYPHHAFTTSVASTPSGEYTTILKINNAKMNNNNAGSMVNGWETEDAGNRFQINEVGSISADDYNALVAEIKEACNAKRSSMLSDYDYTYGTTLGTYTWNKTNTDAAKEAADALNDPTANNYYTSLFAAIRKYDVNYTPRIVVPQENSFLRVKNNSSNKYVSSNATAGNAVPLVTEEDATSILYYDGSKFIGYMNGLGFIETYKAADLSQTKENISFSESSVRGKYYLQSNYSGSKYWHGGGNNLNRNSSPDASCIWNLSYVDALPVNMVNVAGGYYASLYSPVAVTLPEGVKAYSGKAQDGVLTLTKIVEGGILAKWNAVVLYSANEVTEPFAITTGGDAAQDNDLMGTTAALTTDGIFTTGAYVLNKSGDNVGFYKAGDMINGFKAFLPASAGGSSNVLSFRFEDIATAIDAIENTNTSAEIFDLNGRRLNKAQKGMNIINGMKVLVK